MIAVLINHMLFLRVMFARARFIEIFYVVIFCRNVLIGAPGRRLYRKKYQSKQNVSLRKINVLLPEKMAIIYLLGYTLIL